MQSPVEPELHKGALMCSLGSYDVPLRERLIFVPLAGCLRCHIERFMETVYVGERFVCSAETLAVIVAPVLHRCMQAVVRQIG